MAYDTGKAVTLLRNLGYPQAADDAARELPDPVYVEEFCSFADRYAIARDELVSRMGGSP